MQQFFTSLHNKLNKLTNWQTALVITIIGFIVYQTGLTSPFQGDDLLQIVNNVPVHSVANIKLFFEGGTFYNGQGLSPLSGDYFRPLMTTAFSLIYTVFGPRPIYFHMFQLLLCIGSSILFYLFLCYSCTRLLSLFLAVVLLVHPIDSETVFSIPVTQDALYFFFSILGLYLLVRLKTVKSLIVAALCFMLAIFSKETALIFIVMAWLYLFWWDRRRLLPFMVVMVIPIAVYTALRIHAIGLLGSNPSTSLVDHLSLGHRLMSAPAILLFYLTKFIFPWKLATGYFWAYPNFSIRHVLLPLLVDLTIIGFIVFGARRIRRTASEAMYYTYIFFATWLAVSLVILIQIVPLDETVSEPWFYASMVGILGLIGVSFSVWRPSRTQSKYCLMLAIIIVGILGVRTSLRGLDWRSPHTLAVQDITASPQDYVAYTVLANIYFNQGDNARATYFTQRSIAVFPSSSNYNTLGLIYFQKREYSQAQAAFFKGMQDSVQPVQLYENAGALTLWYGNAESNNIFLLQSLKKFPKDGKLWLDLAILYYRYKDFSYAQRAVVYARSYGDYSPYFYQHIMEGNYQPFTLPPPDLK
jgi:hypothetical protein